MIVRALSIACALAAAGSACEGEEKSTLSGSIADAGYSLTFDYLRATRDERELVIRYVDEKILANSQAVTNQPVRLVVDLSTVTPEVNQPLDIEGDVDLQHAVIDLDDNHQLVDEPEFPMVQSGQLKLTSLGTAEGEQVHGSFECLFVNNHTLYGDFFTKLSMPP